VTVHVSNSDPREPPLPRPLAALSRQLWFAVDPAIQFRLRTLRSMGNDDVAVLERYWLLPTPSRARMLLPASSPDVTAGSARNYRRIRAPRERAARAAVGALSGSSVPIGARVLQIEVPKERSDASSTLPIRAIAAALGRDGIQAAVGIRTGANAKATLQLVDSSGAPVGYAKLGWNSVTDEYVRTETAALSAVGHGKAIASAPGVLATFEYAGHPVVVTQPLPADVRFVKGHVAPPTSAEMYALCPIVRRGSPASTHQFKGLHTRLRDLTNPMVSEPVGWALNLLKTVAEVDDRLPVTSRWHGDFTPWNCARDGRGVLWVWDWETSASDALAGLDALHWAYSEQRQRGVDLAEITVAHCLDSASQHLIAAGVPRSQWRTLAQVYVATVIERACGLALANQGWDRVWISADQLTTLAQQVAE